EFLEEVGAGRGVVERPAVGDACRPHGVDCLTRYGRVPGQGDLALVLGLEQVVPVLWDVGDLRAVHLEGQDAVVVAVPEAVRVLGGRRDRVPRCDLVWREVARRLGRRASADGDVKDVGR